MKRSTRSQKAQRLNAAYALLADGCKVAEAVERLCEQFQLSKRQAYRYVRTARTMSAPAQVAETPVPITLKIPGSLVTALRAHARNSGLSMGEIVSRALAAFFRGSGGHG